MWNRLCAALISAAVLLVAGCNDIQKNYMLGRSNEIPQSQAYDWTSDLKMHIESCTWSGQSMAISLTMTNNGNQPMVPARAPVFQLKSASGKLYQPENVTMCFSAQVGPTNINPGSTVRGSLQFNVPHDTYKLLVEQGGPNPYMIEPSGPLVFVWLVEPTGT